MARIGSAGGRAVRKNSISFLRGQRRVPAARPHHCIAVALLHLMTVATIVAIWTRNGNE
jgi:hypothetical protein